jgi:hypothetical protein
MAFKGLKKIDVKHSENHFDVIEKNVVNETIESKTIQIGRPFVDDYKKQNKRVQFYVSQELIDLLQQTAFQNGCKDITAYAKRLLETEFEKIKENMK